MALQIDTNISSASLSAAPAERFLIVRTANIILGYASCSACDRTEPGRTRWSRSIGSNLFASTCSINRGFEPDILDCRTSVRFC